VVLSWSTSTGATYYDIGVRDVATNNLVVNTTTSSTSYTANLSAAKGYKWNVAAGNTAGESSFTTPLYFQTPAAITIPATPAGPSPGSMTSPGPTQSGNSVVLNWSASAGATYYDIGVRDLATNNLVVSTTSTSTSYTANLSAGGSYKWNVAAGSTAGESSFTTPLYFQTPAAATIPATPNNPSPGATASPGPMQTGTSVTLNWTASTGATSYDIGVRDLATNNLVVSTTTTSTSYTTNLAAGGSYRWNVAAMNTAGESQFTTALYFQIPAAITIPVTPSNPLPGSTTSPGPVQSGVSVTLSWSASSGATSYDIGVRDLATNNLVVNTTTTSTSYTASLSAGGSYKWNVAAMNTAGESQFTTALYFQTPAATAVAPSIASPGDTTSPGPVLSTLTPTFTWSAATNATGYGLYVRDLTTNNLIYPNASGTTATPLTGTSLSLPNGFLVAGHAYRWNMTSFVGATESPVSNLRYFQTPAATAAAPALLTPGSAISPGPKLTTTTPTFTWSAVSAATGYGLYVRDVTTGSLVYPNANGTTGTPITGTSFPLSSGFLVPGHSYRWNMTSFIDANEGSVSSVLYFQTPDVIPPAPRIDAVSPASPVGSDSPQGFTITGANFITGANVTLRDLTTNEVFPSRAVSAFSGTTIVINPDFTTAAHGWSVEVINPDGQTSGQYTFTVQAPGLAPSISSVTPASPSPSSTGQTLTITGWNFSTSPNVTLRDRTTGVVYANRQLTSATSGQITLTFTFSAPSHDWSVEVTNVDGQASGAFRFSVGAAASPAPSIAGIQPQTITLTDAAQLVTVTGANFQNGATITLTSPRGAGAQASKPTFIFASQMTFQLPANADAGTWGVVVTNPDGQSSTMSNFGVTAKSQAPTLYAKLASSTVGSAGGSTTVEVSNTGTGTMNYLAAVTGVGGAAAPSWLRILSGASGGNAGTVTINYTTNDGAQRSGTIAISAADSSGSNVAGSPIMLTITQQATTSTSVLLPGSFTYIRQIGHSDMAQEFKSANACGPCTAVMILTYYKRLPAHTIGTAATPATEDGLANDFSWYVAPVDALGNPARSAYSYAGYTFDAGNLDVLNNGTVNYGAYGFLTNVPPGKDNPDYPLTWAYLALQYLWKHGLWAQYVESALETDVRGEIDAGRPVMLATDPAGSLGHILMIHGYTTTQLIAADPWIRPSDPTTDRDKYPYTWQQLHTSGKLHWMIDGIAPIIAGQRVRARQSFNVRDQPAISGATAGAMRTAGAFGTVVNDDSKKSPFWNDTGHTWVKVRWDSDTVTGWSAIGESSTLYIEPYDSPVGSPTAATVQFGGAYSGKVSNGGDAATYIRADGSGSLLSYVLGGNQAYVVTFQVGQDGTVQGSGIVASAPKSSASQSGIHSEALATSGTVTFIGQISNGVLTGTFAETGTSLSASVAPSTGSASGAAGFYVAPQVNASSGAVYSVVNASGDILVVAISSSGVDGGKGVVGQNGVATITGGAGTVITTTIDSNAQSFAATVATPTSTQPTTFAGVSTNVDATRQLSNLSTRGFTGTGSQVLIAGFFVTGSSPKQVLIRAVGPTLSSFGVSGVLPSAKLQVFASADKTLVAENANWTASLNAGDIMQASVNAGAFPLAVGSRDAALLLNLAPGGYSAVCTGADGGTGVTLIEVYEAIAGDAAKLVNISTRGQVGTGSGVLIGGFVISGNAPKKVLIRATGPGLSPFGVDGVLADPMITVYDGNSQKLAENDNWSAGADASLIAAASSQVGAFPLVSGSRDAALLITLSPGAYSAVCSGVGETTGIALIEIYEVP
jgi:hypothetical protein